MGVVSDLALPNVFPEFNDVACTFNGSVLIVKNTFIDVECQSQDCTSDGSTRSRARSQPPPSSELPEGDHFHRRGHRADTLHDIRQRLLSEDLRQHEQHDLQRHSSGSWDGRDGNSVKPRMDSLDEGADTHRERSPDPHRGSRDWWSETSSAGSGASVSFAAMRHEGDHQSINSALIGDAAMASSPPALIESAKEAMGEEPLKSPWSSEEVVDAPNPRTTAILRNLPDDYTRDMLLETLNANGFYALFDFVYMPMNFGTNTSFGYSFINFVTPENAERFKVHFEGFSHWSVPSSKKAYVEWGGDHQGLEEQIDRYRNSAMMHDSVADEAKPILLRNGTRVPFPAPTRELKPLRIRLWKKQQSPCLQLVQNSSESDVSSMSSPHRKPAHGGSRGSQQTAHKPSHGGSSSSQQTSFLNGFISNFCCTSRTQQGGKGNSNSSNASESATGSPSKHRSRRKH